MHELCAACARLRCFSGLDLGREQHSIEDESLNHEPSNTWKYKAEAESRKQDLRLRLNLFVLLLGSLSRL